jgi:NAD(P)-dependent dehydrogenase (short-subunit alcohol dehydrogenase family)
MTQLTWLVTGCSSGIGEVFVRRILARGDRAIATARGDVERLAVLKDAGAAVCSLDVTATQADINAKVEEAIAIYGSIDVVVNSAGYIEAGIAEEVT